VDANNEISRGAVVVGVTGAVASGKTTVAQMLAEIVGGRIISADDIGHELLASDAEIKQQVIERWPDACAGGEVSRQRLARIVFDSPGELAELNRIIHPRILERIREEIDTAVKESPAWVVLDAALLFETGLDKACDVRIFVETTSSIRAQRVKQWRGWKDGELGARQKAQMPPQRKRELCNHTVVNNGSKNETKQQIEEIVTLIKRHRRKLNGKFEGGQTHGQPGDGSR